MPAPSLLIFGGLSVAAFVAAMALLLRRNRNAASTILNAAEGRTDAANEVIDALLLDRADGAAIWAGRSLHLAIGAAELLQSLADPGSFEDVAAALAQDGAELTAALRRLIEDGDGFEMSVRSLEGQGRTIIGRPLGSRALIGIVEQAGKGRAALARETHLVDVERQSAELSESFAHAPFLAWRRDDEGRPIWANQAYVEAVEAGSLADVVDRGVELVSGTEATAIRDLASRAHTVGKAQTRRATTVIGGARVILEMREIPVVGGTLGFATDVTAQVGAADALRKHIEANELTLDRLHRGVAVFSKDLQLSYFNDAIAQLWQLSPGWLETHPHFREVLNGLRDGGKVPQTRNFATWRTETLERYGKLTEPSDTHWHLPNGGAFHVLAQPHPLGGLLLVFEDVTDFFELKRDMATVSAVQRAAFSRLSEGVLVLGLDGRRRLSNDAFDDMWGLTEDMLKDAHIREIAALCAPLYDDEEIWTRMIEQVSGGEETRRPWTESLHRKDGAVLHLATTVLPDGATMFAFSDVTDSVNKERSLREQNEKLEELSDLKSAFLDSIHDASQELKIPLNTIIGFTEILGQQIFGQLNEKQREYVDGVYTASNDLRHIVSGITDLAMIQADDFPFRIERIALRPVLEATLRFIERGVAEQIEFQLDCPEDIGDLPGDAPRFREIVHNLVNSVRSECGEGVIQIGIRRDDKELRLWIGAENTPLSPETRAVFEDEGKDLGSPGLQRNALGTTLVKQFVERQGGHITLESGVGVTQEAIICHFLTDETAVRVAVRRERESAISLAPKPRTVDGDMTEAGSASGV